MSDGSVPLHFKQLEDLVTQVASELLEHWAINGRYEESEQDKAAQNAIDDTVYVINSYMIKFNELIAIAESNKSNVKIQTK
jgi:hypothetical protein